MDPWRRGVDVFGWRSAEILAWTLGIVCLGAWAGSRVSSELGRRDALAQFQNPRLLAVGLSPDQSLWSPERIRAFREVLKHPSPQPIAILRIRQLGIEVPVLEGTNDRVLDRGAGHIAETSAPGAPGNSGIAGHRDGFFRPLKDVQRGAVLELETPQGVTKYRVDRAWIVAPEDVWVLDPTPYDAVTLVTCYPFYFIGSAPQRFIVRAVRESS